LQRDRVARVLKARSRYWEREITVLAINPALKQNAKR